MTDSHDAKSMWNRTALIITIQLMIAVCAAQESVQLYPAIQDGMYGYIDINGKMIILRINSYIV